MLNPRKSLPTNKANQIERLRWAILNKARMERGLSPEEFKELSEPAVNDIIKDQQLIGLVRNPNRTFSDEELKVVIEKVMKFGKSEFTSFVSVNFEAQPLLMELLHFS